MKARYNKVLLGLIFLGSFLFFVINEHATLSQTGLFLYVLSGFLYFLNNERNFNSFAKVAISFFIPFILGMILYQFKK